MDYTNDLFMEPKTKQYGSHMIMSNVRKVPKVKYINVDTRFRDEYNYTQLSNYNITLPERINDVKSMKVVCAEIPMSFYNISLALGNSFFSISDTPNVNHVITIPDGQYNTLTLCAAINSQISSQYGSVNLAFDLSGCVGGTDASGTSSYFVAKSSKHMTLNFACNIDGTHDKYNFKTKLGWLLGFRQPTYTITYPGTTLMPTAILSEALIDVNGPRYLYLAIDEFNKGNQSSFVPPLHSSLVNKNIIARITMNGPNYGRILAANMYNGLLMSDARSYTGKIDLLKLNVQLLNENGSVMNLNGLDFSFCAEIVSD
jgi:hypothetical protein